MKAKILVVCLLVVAALVCGVVIADSTGTTQINGDVPPATLTLTAPINVPSWHMSRGQDNDLSLGNVEISTNDGTGVPCTLKVSNDNNGMMYFSPDTKTSYLQTPLQIANGISWQSLTSGDVDLWSGSLSTSTVNVPIALRQHVTSTDVAHDYTITLVFSLTSP